jgi:hypothetical protein
MARGGVALAWLEYEHPNAVLRAGCTKMKLQSL